MVGIGTSGFSSYEIVPFYPDIIPDYVFELSVAFGAKQDRVSKLPCVMGSSEVPTTSKLTLHPRKATSRKIDTSAYFTSNSTIQQRSARKSLFRYGVPVSQSE